MTKFLISAGHLAKFMSATSGILLVGAAIDPAPFAGMALQIWHGQHLADDSALLSASAGAPRTGDEIDIPVSPAGIVAVLFAENEPETPWREWFAANLGSRGPQFVTGDPALAVCAIAARLIAEQTRIVGECADLHLALARLRQDYEQIVTVSSGMVRALAYQPPGELTLQAAVEASDESIRLDPRHPILVQPLGTRIDRIATLAIAVAKVKAAGADELRARLSGVESGRIFGSWMVGPTSLSEASGAGGWLVLEMPTPVDWAPETAQLELHFSSASEGFLELALDAAAGFPENLPLRPGAETHPADRPLAVKIWYADLGSRFVMPEHWDWTELGSSTHLAGIPLAMPLSAYARVRVLQGGMPRSYNPTESHPMAIGLFGGRQTLVVFPLVCTAGMDVVEAAFTLRGGDVGNLAVAVWLQPIGRVISNEADLLPADPNVVWSGWHSFGGKGDARLALELPVGAAANLQLVVVLDATARPASGLSLVEINKIVFHALTPSGKSRRRARLVNAATDAVSPVPRSAGLAASVVEVGEAAVTLREVILDEHFDNGGHYRHLDMRLRKFAVGDYSWPFLKFRVIVDQGSPALEFRDIPSWPASLKNWPAASADSHGRLTRLFGYESEVTQLRTQGAPEDLALIRGLVHCLPGVVAKAALLAELADQDYARWTEIGEGLAGKLARHASLGKR